MTARALGKCLAVGRGSVFAADLGGGIRQVDSLLQGQFAAIRGIISHPVTTAGTGAGAGVDVAWWQLEALFLGLRCHSDPFGLCPRISEISLSL